MERWDIYDSERRKTGRTGVRGEPIAEGDLHLVIHVCIFNSSGEMLIQRRAPEKKGWGGRWDVSCGGCAVAEDTSQSAAEREVLEELGLAISLDGVRPKLTVNFNHCFDDIYLIEQDVDISALRLQREEVAEVKWAAEQEILEMIADGRFIPYFPELVTSFFAMRRQYGWIDEKYRDDAQGYGRALYAER